MPLLQSLITRATCKIAPLLRYKVCKGIFLNIRRMKSFVIRQRDFDGTKPPSRVISSRERERERKELDLPVVGLRRKI